MDMTTSSVATNEGDGTNGGMITEEIDGILETQRENKTLVRTLISMPPACFLVCST